MNDKSRKEYTVSIEVPDGMTAEKEDKAYFALFGVIDLLDQIDLNYEQKSRVMKALSIFLDK